MLKLTFPHRESELEADALERWDGDGAVRLLARDDERHALLLERCEPGTFLSGWDGDALGVLVGLLPRLWKSGDGFTRSRTRPALGGPRGRRRVAGEAGRAALHPRARADAGRAGARQPGPARRERARRGARAVARDRPEAARRRARVLRSVDRPLVRARPLEARRSAIASTGSAQSSASTASGRAGGRSRRRSRGPAAATTSGRTWRRSTGCWRMRDAPRRSLRRRLHARAARPGARPGRLRPRGRAPRPDARPGALRRRAGGGARRPPRATPTSSTTTRSGSPSPSGSSSGWAGRSRPRTRARSRSRARGSATTTSSSTTTRSRCSPRCERPG